MEACKTGCMSALLMSLTISLLIRTSYGSSWTYRGDRGVNHWSALFPESCAGRSQSPVDLTPRNPRNPRNMRKNRQLGNFIFTNFNGVSDVVQQLSNTGLSVVMSYQSGDLRVSGGGLCSEFKVLQLHFHWGSLDTQGSEHTICGESYPMEMHVVTFNLKYDNLTNALNYADGLAVLGVFFKVGNSWNSNFDTITNALPSIMTPGSSIQLDPIPLDQLLPSNTKHYYRYQGSLTTPPCTEAVIWTVFRDPVTISYDQMEAFRALQSSERDEKSNGPLPLVDNYRPPQPLNGRKIKISFKGRQ
ncbi:carbonic anhydrase 3-like [Littorina saxatilis]|uniref:Carbonic anhydrase n=1 Tax=Littorina saxatilis TaxID=31220 RepID=A0AAN9BU63_9CAEN